mgnify:CR=1 FL=1
MGLLIDKYNEYLEKLRGVNLRPDDDFSGMDSDFNSSLGDGIKASLRERKGGSPLTKEGGAIFPTSIFPQNQGQIKTPIGNINLPKSVLTKDAAANQAKAIADSKKIPDQDASKTVAPDIMKTGTGSKYATDSNFLNKIADLANIDLEQAKKQWSDKGGFNGLMANPAFTLGLAFMQAGARGEKLGQNLLDNVLKSSAISEQYKKKLADKTEIMEVTAGDMNQIKNVLSSFNISAPFFRKLLPGNQAEMYEQAVEDVAFAVQKKVRAKVKAAKKAGKDIKVGTRLYKETIQEMIDKGEIDQKGGLKLFGYSIFDSTLEAKAEGGPINAGQAYLVGEKGPEIVIPHSSGNVVANDDSQVFNMLLASNPQLQRVSKERAMKILKAKFPEYFD